MPNSTRTALITGANRGIGLAICQGLAAQHDIRLLVAARSLEAARETADSLNADNAPRSNAIAVKLDLSDPARIAEQARNMESEHGSVDILINNAGILVRDDALTVSLTDIQQSLAVNTVAPLLLIQTLGAGMEARGWGRIVNLSSGWGSFHEGMTGPLAYSISKAALNALTLSFAQTFNQVKVNAVCPGWVRTRMGGESAHRSPEEGADTPIWLATIEDDGPTGGFFRNRRPIKW